MKNIISLSALLLLVSCGNPHISSLTKDQPIRAPLATDCLTNVGTDTLFFIGDKVGFGKVTECAHQNNEDFQNVDVGQTHVVRGPGYEVTHHTQNGTSDKVETLDFFFGQETFNMSVENPLLVNGGKGLEKGLNSLDANSMQKDALVWSFEHPVSAFSLSLVGFRPFVTSEAVLRTFDCTTKLIDERKISDTASFVGLVSPNENVCYVSLTAGRNSEAIGVDDFQHYYR